MTLDGSDRIHDRTLGVTGEARRVTDGYCGGRRSWIGPVGMGTEAGEASRGRRRHPAMGHRRRDRRSDMHDGVSEFQEITPELGY